MATSSSPAGLYNPDDTRTPYTILFDTRTWTPITPAPVKHFRGFTYDVPSTAADDPAIEG